MSRRKDNVVRMEKRATNHFGLFLVIIISIAGFGFGGYYLYKNREKFDWNIKLPWQKDTDEQGNSNQNTNKGLFGNKKNNKVNQLVVPSMSDQKFSVNDCDVKLYDIKGDDKGYTFSVDLKSNYTSATLTIEKVLIDGFDTSAKLTITDFSDSEGTPTSGTVRVDKSELDALGIYAFKNLTIYVKVDTSEKKGTPTRLNFQVYNNIEYKNDLEGLIEIYHSNNILINYYKIETDKDNTYIYFNIFNEDRSNPKKVRIKKLLVNDELYDYSEIEEDLYSGTNKVFYLTIPKKKVKDVENITIAFFVIDKNYEGETTGIHMTSDYRKEI